MDASRSDSTEPKLCKVCRSIDVLQPYFGPCAESSTSVVRIFYTHYASLSELNDAAQHCEMCKMLSSRADDDYTQVGVHTPQPVLKRSDSMDSGHGGALPLAGRTELDLTDPLLPLLLEIVLDTKHGFSAIHLHWSELDSRNILCRFFSLGVLLVKHTSDGLTSPDAKFGSNECQSTGSRERLELAQAWIRRCDETHTHCHAEIPGQDERSMLPTRVLDVGDDRRDPFLYVPEPKTRCEYVCLSHCWGPDLDDDFKGDADMKVDQQVPRLRRLTTTRETLEKRKVGMSLATMPKTFNDAIIITRALGYRYLWIDSLCILQDKEHNHDWPREAARMKDYYGNAALTLTADAASSDDEGIITSSCRTQGTRLRVPMFDALAQLNLGAPSVDRRHSTISSYHLENRGIHSQIKSVLIDAEFTMYPWDKLHMLELQQSNITQSWIQHLPLHRRIWTLQEWVLSPRTLSFDNYEVRWNCKTHMACECNPEGVEHYATVIGINRQMLYRRQQTWDMLINSARSREVTKQEDILPAVAGLAASFAPLIDERSSAPSLYRAGLWLPFLRRDLAWSSGIDYRERIKHMTGKPTTMHPCYGPSWSWAKSCNIGISMPGVYCRVCKLTHGMGDAVDADGQPVRLEDVTCAIVSCKTEPVSDDNPLGAVRAGELVLRGKMGRVVVVKNDATNEWHVVWNSVDDGSGSDRTNMGTGPLRGSVLKLDVPSASFHDKHVWCMPLVHVGYQTTAVLCLALVPAAAGALEERPKFRRVGTTQYDFHNDKCDHLPIPWLEDVRIKDACII